MGLTSETRNYFVTKINAVLDRKIAKASEGIDQNRVAEVAVKRFCEKVGLDKRLTDRWYAIQKEQETLREEESEIERKVEKALRNAKRPEECRYGHNITYIEDYALANVKGEVIAELYPEIYAEVRKIELIKEDVYGSVLLATTEPKLVAILTKLLNNYGGDISELLALIPKQ